MKHLNKVFGLSLAALSASPALAGVSMTNNASTTSLLNSVNTEEENTEVKHQACTVTYIGKNCTSNGQAIIARATDCSPKAVHLKLKHYKRDELANKTLEGKLGLKYKMPEHTYAYTACPLSDKTSDDPVWATGNWENNGINEMGVGTSSTLTCTSSNKILNLEGESFIDEGVGEELLTTIMTPQAASAKEAMMVAAKAIDDYGAQDANIIMATDQNESWLMEIYSRHQYCAVKLPDDMVCIAGNEFILDSLVGLGITEANKEDCIVSPALLETAQKAGVDYYVGDTKDVYHLKLFDAYAIEGKGSGVAFSNGCHRRTWRGYTMFDKTETYYPYDNTKKYPAFLVPKNADGTVNHNMSVSDVFQVYRDEFDDIVDPTNPTHFDKNFYADKIAGTIRNIAVQQTRQVHIMSSDPNKPKWLACNEWYTPDSANYTPYLQFNNAVTNFDGEYGYYPERFVFDEGCSSVLFRELNKLAWYDRTNYGYPLQEFWRVFENVYNTQMQQVTNDVASLSQDDATNILNNFNRHVRDIYIAQVKKTKNDLMWHIMDQPSTSHYKFIPLVDLQQFVTDMGWSNYKFDGSKVTFEKDSIKATYTISDGVIYGEGTLELSTGYKAQLRDSVENNKVYLDFDGLNKAISQYSTIKTINIYDYLSKFNHWVWIGPTIGVLVIAAGLATFFIIRNQKNKNKKSSKRK